MRGLLGNRLNRPESGFPDSPMGGGGEEYLQSMSLAARTMMTWAERDPPMYIKQVVCHEIACSKRLQKGLAWAPGWAGRGRASLTAQRAAAAGSSRAAWASRRA